MKSKYLPPVSVTSEMFRRIERERRSNRITRSEVIRRAIAEFRSSDGCDGAVEGPYPVRLNVVCITPDDYDYLTETAYQLDVSRNEVVRRALSYYFEKKDDERKSDER